ncbi:hypothetical protein Tco_0516716 [Tanacetum coccineum]
MGCPVFKPWLGMGEDSSSVATWHHSDDDTWRPDPTRIQTRLGVDWPLTCHVSNDVALGPTRQVAGSDPEAHVAAVRECQVADCSTRYNHWLVIRANDWYAGSEVADSRRLRVTHWLVEKGITKVSMMRYQVRIPSQ